MKLNLEIYRRNKKMIKFIITMLASVVVWAVCVGVFHLVGAFNLIPFGVVFFVSYAMGGRK